MKNILHCGACGQIFTKSFELYEHLRECLSAKIISIDEVSMSKYPENEKLDNDYKPIMEFINFLKNKGYEIRKWKDPEDPVDSQSIVYDFFEVDIVELEKERRKMLAENINKFQDS